jgi:hypothetical protein
MKITENLIGQVVDEGRAMTDEERATAIDEALSFEECQYSKDELESMIDSDLCKPVYHVWCDYASGQL